MQRSHRRHLVGTRSEKLFFFKKKNGPGGRGGGKGGKKTGTETASGAGRAGLGSQEGKTGEMLF